MSGGTATHSLNRLNRFTHRALKPTRSVRIVSVELDDRSEHFRRLLLLLLHVLLLLLSFGRLELHLRDGGDLARESLPRTRRHLARSRSVAWGELTLLHELSRRHLYRLLLL